jgi:phosphoglycerol transferase
MTTEGPIQGLKHEHRPEARIALRGPGVAPELELQSLLILLLAFSVLSLCFIVKSLALHFPFIIGDEYYYSILFRYFHHQDRLFAHNTYLPHMPNDFYLWLFHSSRLFGDSSYQLAKILNSLFFAAAIFPIYGLSRRFLQHVPALLLSLLIIIGPLENYTAYFMPESCYFLGFWLFVFLFLSNLPHWSAIAGTWGGVALGMLTLIKPHALAVLGGANLTLIAILFLPKAFDLKRRDTVRCLVILNGAWFTTVVMLHVVLFGHRDLDIFGYYWGMNAPIPDRFVFTKDVIIVLLRHLAYLAPMFGLPIVATVLATLGWLPGEVSESQSRLRILTLFAIIVCGCLLVMTGAATAEFGLGDSGALSRVHGRYYDFALPLFLIALYSLRCSELPDRARKLFFFGILASLVLVFVSWQCFARLCSLNLIDYPEMAWVTRPHHFALSVFWPLAALVLVYYAIVGFKERTTYSIYLVFVLAGGNILTASAQQSLDAEAMPDRAGALIRSLFDGEDRDVGLVVGSDPGIVRRCLFGIQANPLVLEIPARTPIDQRSIGKEVKWVLALDDYDLRVPVNYGARASRADTSSTTVDAHRRVEFGARKTKHTSRLECSMQRQRSGRGQRSEFQP